MGDRKYLVIGCVLLAAGCAAAEDEVEIAFDEQPLIGCGRSYDAAGVYTPYPGSAAAYPSGPASATPWAGEDFEAYGPGPAVSVECASTKGRRSHLEVTAGCLDAVTVAGQYVRGVVRPTAAGAFRALALGHTADDPTHPIQWTDQGIEYRFHYRGATGTTGNPGFKAFARYRSEDDLYVASWRLDGVVQIQRKQCGVYTPLALIRNFGPPSPNAWHWLRFDAVDDQLELYLDRELVLTATASAPGSGTVGIRADSVAGAYLDDWRLVTP